MSAAFNNVAVSDDGNTSLANFDGGGASFSAQALAAGGATAGKTMTTGGVTLTWPSTARTGRPGASVPLSAGKTVASVRLPAAGAVPIQPGMPSLHVFAAGIG